MSRIVVLGSGAWGTAIALSLHRRGGHSITLWAHSPSLPRRSSTPAKTPYSSPAFPSRRYRHHRQRSGRRRCRHSRLRRPLRVSPPVLTRIRPHLRLGQFVVSATKGVEDRTFLRMTQVISETLERAGLLLSIGAFSGPSFALEVAQGQPTAVTVAFSDPEIAALIQQEFSSETFASTPAPT